MTLPQFTTPVKATPNPN